MARFRIFSDPTKNTDGHFDLVEVTHFFVKNGTDVLLYNGAHLLIDFTMSDVESVNDLRRDWADARAQR